MKKGFLIKTGVCAMSAVILLGGIAGCQRRDAVQTTTATVAVEDVNTVVRPLCENAGQTFMEGIISLDFAKAVSVIDYENHKDAESKMYLFYDTAARASWSYNFFVDRVSQAKFVASNFDYDPGSATALIDYRVSLPDYTGISADGEIKYTLSLTFKYDTTKNIAVVTNPEDAIDFYRAAERDYANFLIDHTDMSFLSDETTPTTEESAPTETTAMPTPVTAEATTVPTRAPDMPDDDPGPDPTY